MLTSVDLVSRGEDRRVSSLLYRIRDEYRIELIDRCGK